MVGDEIKVEVELELTQAAPVAVETSELAGTGVA